MSIAASPIGNSPVGGQTEQTSTSYTSTIGIIGNLASALVVAAAVTLTAPVVASGSAGVTRTNGWVVANTCAVGGGEASFYYSYWGKKLYSATTLVVAGGAAGVFVEQFPSVTGGAVGKPSITHSVVKNLIQTIQCIGGGSARPTVKALAPITGSMAAVGTVTGTKETGYGLDSVISSVGRGHAEISVLALVDGAACAVAAPSHTTKVFVKSINDPITTVAAPASIKFVSAAYRCNISAVGKGYSRLVATPLLNSTITAAAAGNGIYSFLQANSSTATAVASGAAIGLDAQHERVSSTATAVASGAAIGLDAQHERVSSIITVISGGTSPDKNNRVIDSTITAVVTSAGWYAQRDYNTSEGGGVSGGSATVSTLFVQDVSHNSVIGAIGFGSAGIPGYILTQHVYLASRINAVALPYIDSTTTLYTVHKSFDSTINVVANSSDNTIYIQAFFKALVLLVADDIPVIFIVEDI